MGFFLRGVYFLDPSSYQNAYLAFDYLDIGYFGSLCKMPCYPMITIRECFLPAPVETRWLSCKILPESWEKWLSCKILQDEWLSCKILARQMVIFQDSCKKK